jgi:hypothetical protein
MTVGMNISRAHGDAMHGDDLVARPSGSISVTWGFAPVPDRAKANSAILRCQTRVVPLRTVNESYAMRTRSASNVSALIRISTCGRLRYFGS